MTSVSYANAKANLSTCEFADPVFDSLTIDQVIDRIERTPIGTECQKQAPIAEADKPAVGY